MEETKSYASGTEQIAAPIYRPRQRADVPEDVDFLMEHLNDPNYDLKKGPPSITSPDLETKKLPSELDAESNYDSDRYSTSRAESRNSTAIEFDE